MKRGRTVWLGLGMICLAVITAQAQMTPINLRSDFDPSLPRLSRRQLRLSWQLTARQRGARQTAFQIVTARSRADLNKEKAWTWNSQKVEGSMQSFYPTPNDWEADRGETWWRVRVWGENGRVGAWSQPSVAATPFGEDSLFEQALWIGRTTETAPTPAPLFRKTFEIDGKVRSATALICGIGYHELHLNGAKVGDHVLDPGYTRYDRRILVVRHDVTKQIKSGKNAIGMMLGNGFYNVTTRNAWDFEKAPWRAAPKVKFVLRIVVDKGNGRGEEILVRSGEAWKTTTGAVTYDNIYGGETYDARLEKPGWDTPEYDDSAWEPAKVVQAPGGAETPQELPPIRVVRTIQPVSLTEPKPGVFIYDMGENMTGWAKLSVVGSAGTKITLRFAERLNKDGTLDNAQIAEHTGRRDPGGRFQTEEYICSGKGTLARPETYEPRFTYHGFQYVEVTGFPGRPTLDTVRGQVAHTDFASAGEFECSNPLLNKIQAATRRSFLGNFFSIPTDCPHREKNGWTGDAHLAAEQALFNFDTHSAYVKWIQDLADEQKPSGELPGIVPSSGWGYDWGNGPAWDSAFLLIPKYVHQYTGDASLLMTHYAQMKRYVDYLTTKAQNGIVSIGLGDWLPYSVETPVEVTSTAYYYRDALIVAETAQLMGKTEDAERYRKLAESIHAAFNARFYHAETGLYANGSQTALACALYQGLTLPNNHKRVLDNLVAAIDRKGGHLDGGILGAKYVLNALLENGREDIAYLIVTQTDLPSWGWWIGQGATTLWEDWKGEFSRNHIMFGDISAWFYKALAGIRSDLSKPGFGHVVIRPYIPNDMTWARANYDSVRGRITSDWKIANGVLTLKVRIPANATGEIYMPVRGDSEVRESGKPIDEKSTVKRERNADGYAVYTVGSGDYTFTTNWKP
jgi:alpha-L-rhamnosidase